MTSTLLHNNTVSGLSICPNGNNTVIYYWDELHNKAGKEKGSGRMICAAVHLDYDPKTQMGYVSYGASMFHKESKHENFVKKNHRNTAKARLEKCPATFLIMFPDIDQVREKWTREIRTSQELFSEVMGRMVSRLEEYSREVVENIVVESHVRDHVIEILKKEVRKRIASHGTKGERRSVRKVLL